MWGNISKNMGRSGKDRFRVRWIRSVTNSSVVIRRSWLVAPTNDRRTTTDELVRVDAGLIGTGI
jgi:hypothetical protein